MVHHFILLWLSPYTLGLIVRDGGLSTLCHSCGFAWEQRMLKMFHGPGYLCYEDGIFWLWQSLVNLYIWLTISSCCSSIPLTLGMIERDGDSSTLCHSWGFACQQRVLKTSSGPGYLHSEDGVQAWKFGRDDRFITTSFPSLIKDGNNNLFSQIHLHNTNAFFEDLTVKHFCNLAYKLQFLHIVKQGKNGTNLTNLSIICYLRWPSLPHFLVLIHWSLAFMNK